MRIDSCGFDYVQVSVHGITAVLASPRGPASSVPNSKYTHMAQAYVNLEGVDLTTTDGKSRCFTKSLIHKVAQRYI